MTDRILSASRPFMDMYIYSILAQRGIPPKHVDIETVVSDIRRTGRAELVLQQVHLNHPKEGILV